MTAGASAIVPVDVLAVGAHPDDAELGCGGTLARLAASGRRVGLLDLTRGEAGSRGTPEIRAREAAEAARRLGAAFRVTLDLGDGALRTDRSAELEVIDVVRRARPRLVFAQHGEDRHADHGRASRLVTDACFYAGLRNVPSERAPHRPQQVVYYPSSWVAAPTFLVDVTDAFERKRNAIRAYESQFHAAGVTGPETFVSSKAFLDGVESLARAFGRAAGVLYAEAFVSRVPPILADPVAAFEGLEPQFPPGAP